MLKKLLLMSLILIFILSGCNAQGSTQTKENDLSRVDPELLELIQSTKDSYDEIFYGMGDLVEYMVGESEKDEFEVAEISQNMMDAKEALMADISELQGTDLSNIPEPLATDISNYTNALVDYIDATDIFVQEIHNVSNGGHFSETASNSLVEKSENVTSSFATIESDLQ